MEDMPWYTGNWKENDTKWGYWHHQQSRHLIIENNTKRLGEPISSKYQDENAKNRYYKWWVFVCQGNFCLKKNVAIVL